MYTQNKYQTVCIYLGLVIITIAAFQQLRNCDFVNYDDYVYVTENQNVAAGLTAKNLVWVFTRPHASFWHPLTSLSLMLDCELFGLNPAGHHITNLLLHIANTLLLFLVLKNMTKAIWQSAFVAAAFALHPLHVESVAWIAERKDVLSAFFWMLAMVAYLRYVKHPDVKWYLLTLLIFIFGLMSKPMVVTLPLVLLLLDYWPLGRFSARLSSSKSNERISRPILEKVPFLVLSVAAGIAAFLIQQKEGALPDIDLFPINLRIANALISYVRYIAKMFWPSRLAVFYPYPADTVPIWQAVVSFLLLVCISILIIRLAKNHKYLLVGWLWFLGTMLPVIGLIQVGSHSMADRYTYIPLTGLFVITAWGANELSQKLQLRKAVLITAGSIILVAMMICTHRQVEYWRNSFTLFEHALKVTKDNYVAHNNLGFAFESAGDFNEAAYHYQAAIKIKPNAAKVHDNLGNILKFRNRLDEAISHYQQELQMFPDYAKAHNHLGDALRIEGKLNEAVNQFQQAIRLQPDYAEAYRNLGFALMSQGRLDAAVSHYQKALTIEPHNVETHYNLGVALQLQNKPDEAAEHYNEALRIKPGLIKARSNLGVILAGQGRLNEAIDNFTEVLRTQPDSAETHNNLGYAFESSGRFNEALEHYRLAVKINPDYLPALNNIANILITHSDPNTRNTNDALIFAERAAGLTNYKDISTLCTLALAYAAAGRYEQAVTTAQTALELASAARDSIAVERINRQLELYKSAVRKTQ